ncbi:MAG: hypothetical protein ACR2QZ_10585 [Woeseiaceae bacterium]
MSGENGNCFSWLSFLLGLAIGLWISVVALFLMDLGNDCDCGTPGTTIITHPVADEAWIPAGDGAYFCTNDDQGRAIVVDQGRAVVVDQGRSIVVDQGGAIVVDQGGAIVIDAGGHVPAPDSSSEQLGRDRDFEEYACETNDQGGAIVVDRAGRIVVVSMPESFDSDRCGRLNGSATVINDEDKRIEVDQGGAIVVDASGTIDLDESADAGNDQELPDDSPLSTTELAYCIVATEASEPVVVRAD